VKKTKRLVVLDGGWKTCGIAAEISARIAESDIFRSLKMPVIRLSLPDTPAPASLALEKVYYPTAEKITSTVKKLFEM
jgi:pyruvate dehydrogenase E1 component beta subunit